MNLKLFNLSKLTNNKKIFFILSNISTILLGLEKKKKQINIKNSFDS